jgi:hypothetical protein
MLNAGCRKARHSRHLSIRRMGGSSPLYERNASRAGPMSPRLPVPTVYCSLDESSCRSVSLRRPANRDLKVSDIAVTDVLPRLHHTVSNRWRLRSFCGCLTLNALATRNGVNPAAPANDEQVTAVRIDLELLLATSQTRVFPSRLGVASRQSHAPAGHHRFCRFSRASMRRLT